MGWARAHRSQEEARILKPGRSRKFTRHRRRRMWNVGSRGPITIRSQSFLLQRRCSICPAGFLCFFLPMHAAMCACLGSISRWVDWGPPAPKRGDRDSPPPSAKPLLLLLRGHRRQARGGGGRHGLHMLKKDWACVRTPRPLGSSGQGNFFGLLFGRTGQKMSTARMCCRPRRFCFTDPRRAPFILLSAQQAGFPLASAAAGDEPGGASPQPQAAAHITGRG